MLYYYAWVAKYTYGSRSGNSCSHHHHHHTKVTREQERVADGDKIQVEKPQEMHENRDKVPILPSYRKIFLIGIFSTCTAHTILLLGLAHTRTQAVVVFLTFPTFLGENYGNNIICYGFCAFWIGNLQFSTNSRIFLSFFSHFFAWFPCLFTCPFTFEGSSIKVKRRTIILCCLRNGSSQPATLFNNRLFSYFHTFRFHFFLLKCYQRHKQQFFSLLVFFIKLHIY